MNRSKSNNSAAMAPPGPPRPRVMNILIHLFCIYDLILSEAGWWMGQLPDVTASRPTLRLRAAGLKFDADVHGLPSTG